MQQSEKESDKSKNEQTPVNYEEGGNSLAVLYWTGGFLVLVVMLYLLGQGGKP